ncbi:terpenoid synthase [Peniophora sp. CONT]|nr:terpenoid synthase [Peniophora sp. CONT]
MGTAYATVHLVYTIPPALFLWRFFHRIRSARDVFLTIFLVTVAMVATTPWDSYLIRTNVWTYPPDAVLGPKLFDIPAEEVFFFFIQTYITSQLYLLASKPVLHPVYLPRPRNNASTLSQVVGGSTIAALCALGLYLLTIGGEYTYLALILSWACSFMLFLWIMTSSHIVALPLTSTLLPIAIPTLYLWIVDTFALQRGTWAIVPGTKTGLYVWPHLELEEALFFLVTNIMIVFGLVAGDKAFAVCDAIGWDAGTSFHTVPLLVKALFTSLDEDKLKAIDIAHETLATKEHGKSFLAASMFFPGPQRIGLLQLYALCRICDNLIDDAPDTHAAAHALAAIRALFKPAEAIDEKASLGHGEGVALVYELEAEARDALRVLYAALRDKVPQIYIEQLLAGFETDLIFTARTSSPDSLASSWSDADAAASSPTRVDDGERYPIHTDADLLLYSQHVAGAVAAMCVCLLWPGVPSDDSPFSFVNDHDLDTNVSAEKRGDSVLYHAQRVGRALQLVNIARDIRVDARDGARCYIPVSFLARPEHNTTPGKLTSYLRARIASPETTAVDGELERTVRDVQVWLVQRAREIYAASGFAIERMPDETKGGLRAAVEQYLALGDELLRPEGEGAMRVRVPMRRRIGVAWRAAGKAKA